MWFSKKSDSEEKDTAADAIDLLKKDHRTVSDLFEKLEGAKEAAEKVALAQQICVELTIHAEAEERVFYPAARKALDEESEDLIDEAAVEHRSLKMLIAEIDGSSPDDALFDANLKVLKEYVEHHVKEEEREMFPKLRGEAFDAKAVGEKLAEVKEELKAKMGEPKEPRAGAKAAVHVPDLSGAKSKSKTANSAPSRRSPPARKPAASTRKAAGAGKAAGARKTAPAAKSTASQGTKAKNGAGRNHQPRA